MAANKFATMLHRNSNKMTLILVYAILEWILIILLLLNSLFSYLIVKFADYFGLKRPCLWCSRLDHIFEPQNNKNLYRDLVCDIHAAEISKLGYCSNHRKLAESQDMCEDCSSSSQPDCRETSKIALFRWVKEIGIIQSNGEKRIENGGVNTRCSCCGESLNSKFFSPYLLIKPSWEVLDYTQKGNLITEAGDGDEIEEGDDLNRSRSDWMTDRCIDEQGIEKNTEDEEGDDGVAENQMLSDVDGVPAFKVLEIDDDDKVGLVVAAEQEPLEEEDFIIFMENPSSDKTLVQVGCIEDASLEILLRSVENFHDDDDDHRLFPVELIDFTTAENQSGFKFREEDQGSCDCQEASLGSKFHVETQVEMAVEKRCSEGETMTVVPVHESEEEPKFTLLESMEIDENQNSSTLHAEERDSIKELYELVAITQATQTPSTDGDNAEATVAEERGSDVHSDVFHMRSEETEAEIVIRTEEPDREQFNEDRTQEILLSHPCILEDPSTSFANLHADNDHGSKQAEEETVECKTMLVEMSEQARNNHLSLCSDLNEIEEERIPDTPTSIEGLHHLDKNLLLEKRESGTEESLDGSVISEFETGERGFAIEKLTSALRAERKALNALYAELEEERSASAVAANQTMAMINRLQEEKAAMQMEALQYQRMMEEQTEYDQEALQLLNELMVKREKEKQELEKELEIYRKKVMEYEAKEKMMMMRRRKESSARSGTSSASCSNAEDSDGVSIDLNREGKEDESFYCSQESGNHNTPVDAVLNLDESLAHFEEERLSILDQLKVLEEKLFTYGDEEEQHFADMKPFEQFYEENGKEFHQKSDFFSEVNGVGNGFTKEMNGHHHQDRTILGSKAKRLLPLFDAIGAETEDGLLNGHENGFDSVASQNSSVAKSEIDSKKLAIEEEVDHVYERLQALEADREFLKHCFSSLKKGDKGIDLLQEILLHLRDLRDVEIRVRNMGDGVLL
ncbi:hypothetical protein L1049_006694 [Liquidambar formosana]|uniref:GTD-binding domain-containing protein n=1 Tax=Liquidambar formosana TaxID=63359 RepID=A0AAP0RFY6_LIQFO